MVETRHVEVEDGDVLVMVGTTKGAFLLRSDARRARWDVAGPYFPGHAVYAIAYDGRNGRRRLLASADSMHFGATVRTSDDFGRTWTNPEQANVKFPAETGAALKQIWQLQPGRSGDPGTVYAGVEPAALFVSRDAGDTWELNQGLYDHPHRARWQPGGGGLCLHTILHHPSDPARMTIAISTGGAYRTADNGRTWEPCNQGVRAEFMPDKYPEYGQCVHKVVSHPARPERLFLQNHWGLYRSDDGGSSWQDIANGVPSDFGFAMAMHPHDADTVYIVPIESDAFRCTPDGKLRVYRTRDAGQSWEPLTKGLPQQDALECILRDSLGTDPMNPAGVYFGTRSGNLWGSRDGGTRWSLLRGGLPPIVCVRAAVVGDVRPVERTKSAKTKPGRKKAAKARPSTAKRKSARKAAGARTRTKATASRRRTKRSSARPMKRTTRRR